jgi:hypothetical protein
MRKPILLLTAGVLSAALACDSTDTAPNAASSEGVMDGHDNGASEAEPPAPLGNAGSGAVPADGFDPPPPADGYTRIVAPVMKDLKPGDDIMHCQYVHGPFDRDMDVLEVQGYQSRAGHHAVAYATTMDVPIGTSRPCAEDDNMSAGFLGGVGGEAGGGVTLPAGVAFRLPKGSSIMLNTHFLNTTDETFDGHSVVDFKFVEADDERVIASLFSNGNLGFKVPPGSAAEALAECTMPRDMQFILFTNHMHDQGAHARTDVVRADGSSELVHEDPHWTYEMQFKANYSQWPLEEPLTIAAGETLRTHCNWQNTTDAELEFPREMCFGVGFFLSDGSSSPVCLDGAWLER